MEFFQFDNGIANSAMKLTEQLMALPPPACVGRRESVLG
jgi:hypothetical protein